MEDEKLTFKEIEALRRKLKGQVKLYLSPKEEKCCFFVIGVSESQIKKLENIFLAIKEFKQAT